MGEIGAAGQGGFFAEFAAANMRAYVDLATSPSHVGAQGRRGAQNGDTTLEELAGGWMVRERVNRIGSLKVRIKA